MSLTGGATVKVHRELASPSLWLILLLAIIVRDFLLDVLLLLLLTIIRILKVYLSPQSILLIFSAQVAAEVVWVFIAGFSRLSVLPLLFPF